MKVSQVFRKKSSKPLSTSRARKNFFEFLDRLSESTIGCEFKNLLDFASWKKIIPEEYFQKDFLLSQNFWFSLYTKDKHLPYRNGFLYFIIKLQSNFVLLSHEHSSVRLCCVSTSDPKSPHCRLLSLNSSLKSVLLSMAFALASIQDYLRIDLKYFFLYYLL